MTFLDANIFMYAAGKASPQKVPCEKLLRKILKPSFRESFCTNTEVLQEILHRYLSLGYREIAFKIVESVFAMGIAIVPVNQNDLRRAKTLLEKYDNLSVRDAIHLGVMQGAGISDVATYDQDFSVVEWVRVLKPWRLRNRIQEQCRRQQRPPKPWTKPVDFLNYYLKYSTGIKIMALRGIEWVTRS